jgi:hypothetical protein
MADPDRFGFLLAGQQAQAFVFTVELGQDTDGEQWNVTTVRDNYSATNAKFAPPPTSGLMPYGGEANLWPRPLR